MTKIYTRTGDAGTTSLVDGQRIPKNSLRIEAYGTIDELNSFIGAIVATGELPKADLLTLTELQSRLFDIGSYLATAEPELAARLLPDLEEPTAHLESEIDRISATLPQLKSFVIPQGTPGSCQANIARTICRRAERVILTLAETAEVAPSVLIYINRLSDYLFILSRHLNLLAYIPETYWIPAKTKKP